MNLFAPLLLLALVAIAITMTALPTGAQEATSRASASDPSARRAVPVPLALSGGRQLMDGSSGWDPPTGSVAGDKNEDYKVGSGLDGSRDRQDRVGETKKDGDVPAPTTTNAGSKLAWQSTVTASAIVALALSLL
ncbi:hypothetical protein ATCC90586_009112 [Pythium insidiosum]|nr:hypothetical protein ATCC90586_009112 [Pythium insidiosum]